MSAKKWVFYLTLSRVFLTPFILFFLFYDFPRSRFIAVGLFGICCLCDFLDGYLARKWKVQSRFGVIMDPAADKILVFSVLISLIKVNHLDKWTTLVIVLLFAREMLVSALRTLSSTKNQLIPAGRWGKWKTTLQMIALLLMILQERGPFFAIGVVFLWASLLFSFISGWQYFKQYLRSSNKKQT